MAGWKHLLLTRWERLNDNRKCTKYELIFETDHRTKLCFCDQWNVSLQYFLLNQIIRRTFAVTYVLQVGNKSSNLFSKFSFNDQTYFLRRQVSKCATDVCKE